MNYCVGETAARLIGKWRNFACDNVLKEGDVCVFVLSKDKKKNCNDSPHLSGCEEFDIISISLVHITCLVS